ncbi:hypothetical protein A2331_03560 [Candidatus Falkowbacteria bacterium RIFOXYB2_FULL_34_18]|uniref:histidine kinase n=1 Tax=Candidatus Falkowbacteria bacterium RIFOXYD2_FULL_34_120 TaxID=1798007 RepID=A0A1F5TS78_9BACT|nr:MAG: hypothetical protein A2331_03560 [Candidatus Falkowbacteria bacterium RIFOXYB2_FULL_34_18]OGF30101.1 MAG: hypothetical protein A2500_04890 [Candidatus Falkowbacteria bacterium RIFOXYC12_FULL_34_55]OGF37565.1 MAG: hypothetical protein A2466_01955 [Candidatus Falkowbacteria bacterium RIFOXYC2_FULL_34_220]OGF39321.1 MAG: hypothetical protein A2515_02370 [Candidatus Falkowbacteria bacterium RIFOXYD12_FULL_34_57]OGF41826.1 MAG: hypothetical protein A2531_05355 [Candidatus Falkowbacteria bact
MVTAPIKIKFRTKFFILLILVSVTPLLLLYFLLPFRIEEETKKILVEDFKEHAHHTSVTVESFFDRIEQDVILLSKNRIIESPETGTEEKLKELQKMKEVRNIYDDIILINKDGNVLTSTSFNYRGAWESRDYFQEALQEKVVLSDAHLILEPKKLVLVAVAPVFFGNEVSSVVAIQLDMQHVWSLIKNFTSDEEYYLVNNNGRLISEYENMDIFEEFKTKEDVKCSLRFKEYTKDGQKILETSAPIMKNKIYKGEGCWNLIFTKNESGLLVYINGIERLIFLILFLAILLSVLVSAFLARSISAPIEQLVIATKEFARGNFNFKTKIKANNELKMLGDSFNKTGEEILKSHNLEKIYSRKLEDEVREKTEKLTKTLNSMKRDKDNLESQRVATLNILEDISESQKEMEDLNIKLKKRTGELEALRKLGNDLSGVLDMEEAVTVINQYLDSFLDFSTVTYLIINPIREEELIYSTYLKEDVSENFVEEVKNDLLKFIANETDSELLSIKKILSIVKPHIFGKRLNNKNESKIISKIIFPLRMGSYSLGAIQIASSKPGLFSNTQNGMTSAMVATFSLSVAKLHTLIRSQHSKTISLVQSLNDGVVMFNMEKSVVLTNKAILDFTGFSSDHFNLYEFDKLFSTVDVKKMINQMFREGNIVHISEIQFKNKFYEFLTTPVKDSFGKIVGGAIILHDITHLKEIDKMKTEFVSVASHQLRTPLTAIKLFTEMLINGDVGELQDRQKQYLGDIYESTTRMVRLVNDLLSLSRLESGRLRVEPVDTNMISFIQSIIEEIVPLASSKNIKIVFEKIVDELPSVAIDPTLMRQVINNLITNAVRYSLGRKEGLVNVNIKKKEKNIEISIKDNGIGIPKEVQSRIFEKFFRADNAIKSETEGTGLGLYVSKMIVESSGGKIWFKSEKNKGTTFFISIPVGGMKRKKGEKTLAGSSGEVSYS